MFRNPTTILLLAGLIAATCVIAYVSDNLGKKLGKKRITFAGLRPRQTATLISMLSSVGIMLFTLTALTLFSSQVKDALLRSDRLRRNNNELKEENAGLQRESVRLGKQAGKSREQAEKARAAEERARQSAQAATESAGVAVKHADERVKNARQQIRTAELRLDNAQVQLKSAQSARMVALQSREAAESAEHQAQASLLAAKGNLEAVNLKLHAAQIRFAALKATTFRVTKTQMAESLKQLLQVEQKRAEVRELTKERENLLAQVEERKAELVELRKTASFYGNAAEFYQRDLYALAVRRVIVDLGHVFAEIVVPPNAEAAQIRRSLYRLLDSGSEAAIKMGGKEWQNLDTGITRALHLSTRREEDSERRVNETQMIDNLVKYLSSSELNVPVSVRLMSARRYAEGETQFEAQLSVVPIRQVYAEGETISEAVIDGSQRDAVVFNRLLDLLNAGGAAAQAKGVTPLLSNNNPELFTAGTNERIFEALRALQKRGTSVQVRMVAAENILTVDNITVRFVLDPHDA